MLDARLAKNEIDLVKLYFLLRWASNIIIVARPFLNKNINSENSLRKHFKANETS